MGDLASVPGFRGDNRIASNTAPPNPQVDRPLPHRVWKGTARSRCMNHREPTRETRNPGRSAMFRPLIALLACLILGACAGGAVAPSRTRAFLCCRRTPPLRRCRLRNRSLRSTPHRRGLRHHRPWQFRRPRCRFGLRHLRRDPGPTRARRLCCRRLSADVARGAWGSYRPAGILARRRRHQRPYSPSAGWHAVPSGRCILSRLRR